MTYHNSYNPNIPMPDRYKTGPGASQYAWLREHYERTLKGEFPNLPSEFNPTPEKTFRSKR